MPAVKRKKKTTKKKGASKRASAVRKIAKKVKPAGFSFRRGHAVIAAAALVLVIFSAGFLFSAGKKEVIMVTDSKACRCVKVKCVSMEAQVKEQLSKNRGKGRLKLLELKDEKNSKPVMDKYSMGMVPCLVVLDKDKNVVYSASGFNFNPDEFSAALTKKGGSL